MKAHLQSRNCVWLRLGVAGTLLAVCAALPLATWRHARARWLDQNKCVQEQARRLASLTAENERLSDTVDRAKGSLPSEGRLRELLRLRGEIGQLRRLAGEAEQLRAMNQRLTAAATNPAPETSGPPPDATVLAHWPKAQLAFTGYADPASALQTTLWAMSRGDPGLLAASLTPEALATIAGQGLSLHRTAAEDVAASARGIADSLSPSSGFYLVGQNLTSPDRAVLDVYFDAEGKTRKFALEKIGAEWKLKAMGAAGAEDGDLGAPVWP